MQILIFFSSLMSVRILGCHNKRRTWIEDIREQSAEKSCRAYGAIISARMKKSVPRGDS